MTFARTLESLAILLMVVMPASAQRVGAPRPYVRDARLAEPAPYSGAARNSSAGRRAAPFTRMRAQSEGAFFTHSFLAAPSASSRFALQQASPAVWAVVSRRFGGPRFNGPRPGFHGESPQWRSFPHFPHFLFGGGVPACSPLLPGFFGAAWFDRQFTCFGTSFYGVDFYPQGFLAPELAYEPWLASVPAAARRMYSVGDGARRAGNLDTIAAIAARESAGSNPSQQVTTLVLKEGINVGVIDYWLRDGKLGYVTSYGRDNTIDLDRLDLDKTIGLNSSRGIPFTLRERPATAAPPQQPRPR